MFNNDIRLAKINDILQANNADYFIYQDDLNIGSAKEGAKHYGISLNETTPTIILKAKNKYFAVIICGNTRISFKKLKQALNIKDISIADPETIFKVTASKIGEVSLINDNMETIIDNNVLKNSYCYGGSGISKVTLKIKPTDLIRITNAKLMDFTEPGK